MTITKHDVYGKLDYLMNKMDYLEAQLLLIGDAVELESRPNCEFGQEEVNNMISYLDSHQIMFNKFIPMFAGLVTEINTVNNILDDVFKDVGRVTGGK